MTWLTIKEVAGLFGITERGLRYKVEQNQLPHRQIKGKGRGGIQYQIPLSSLPQHLQDQYNSQQSNQAPEKNYKPTLHYTGKQREEADRKAMIVLEYWQSSKPLNDFVALYNAQIPNHPESHINIHKLMSWQKKYKKNRDVADLIDTRGEHRRGVSSISDEAWECFCSLYLTLQRPSVQSCWEYTQIKHPNIPSVSTFERKVKTIPKYAIIEFRYGQKALDDNMPSMMRSKLDIMSNDIWGSDHHQMDVFVRNAQGKVVRLWLTVFFDARSNKVISYIAREDAPNATVVKQCFKKGILAYGIPNEVYFDNGKDYKSKAFSRDYPLSVANQLGIESIFAIPYNAKAKSVERFFRTLEDKFNKRFPAYLGKDAKDRPENMRINNEKIAKIAPSMEEYLSSLDIYIEEEYNNTKSKGRDMNGKTPNEVYYENLSVVCRVKDENVLNIICGTFEGRTVGKNGVRILNNYYYDEALIAHYGKKVIVSYVPENIDKVVVFDANMRIINEAHARIVTPYRNTTQEDYNRAKKAKKAIKKFNQQFAFERETNIHGLIASNQLKEKQYAEDGEIATIEHITPRIQQNSRKLKEIAEVGERDCEQEAATDALLKFYQAL